MLTIKSITNPVWANAENTQINVDAEFNEIGGIMPFTACPLDPLSYGVDLFNSLKGGQYGSIGDYVAPIIPKKPIGTNQPVTTGTQTIGA